MEILLTGKERIDLIKFLNSITPFGKLLLIVLIAALILAQVLHRYGGVSFAVFGIIGVFIAYRK